MRTWRAASRSADLKSGPNGYATRCWPLVAKTLLSASVKRRPATRAPLTVGTSANLDTDRFGFSVEATDLSRRCDRWNGATTQIVQRALHANMWQGQRLTGLVGSGFIIWCGCSCWVAFASSLTPSSSIVPRGLAKASIWSTKLCTQMRPQFAPGLGVDHGLS